MRLSIPVDVTELQIVNGPGATRLLDAMIEKQKMGYERPAGPALAFTIYCPFGDPGPNISVIVELIGPITKEDDAYTFYGNLFGGDYVKVKYRLSAPFGELRGSITSDIEVNFLPVTP